MIFFYKKIQINNPIFHQFILNNSILKLCSNETLNESKRFNKVLSRSRNLLHFVIKQSTTELSSIFAYFVIIYNNDV